MDNRRYVCSRMKRNQPNDKHLIYRNIKIK